jgi:Protein of unknown function (DUF3305)
MEKPSRRIAVVMQRRALQHRWQDEIWQAIGVLAPYDAPGGPRALVEQQGESQWLYPGLELRLHRDEAEGYYMNVSTDTPLVFIMWRMEDGRAVPQFVSASYHEASGWMDSGEQVDSVPMAPEIAAWVAEFAREHYRPEPRRKRIRPQSFKRPGDRAKE